MSYQIELLDGSQQKWPIKDYVTLGSDESCQIRVGLSHVSSRHCRLEVRNNKLIIKDQRSEDGTYVNGAKVFEAELQDGDLISVGFADFVVHDLSLVIESFPLSSKNETWDQQLKNLTFVARSNYSVLLLGPSGTGKDVIARELHQCSDRKNQPFVSVNCSALTETLVESELFGHVKGSFTGAIADRKGAFESARGGTLFLDEIGDLPYPLQAKLLRAIENSEIRPVGSDRTIKTDVRIIAATHQNLFQKIREGCFRSDLYYRLNIINIDVPSLKERMEDFDTLLYTFAREMRVRFSYNAIQDLKKHDWPGNIRELKNTVARAATLFPKSYISEQHIEQILNKKDKWIYGNNGASYATSTTQPGQVSVIKEIEKQMILKRLAANNGSQKLTAVDLGMPKSTLHDKIKTYNIDLKEFKS